MTSSNYVVLSLACLSMVAAPKISPAKISAAALFLGLLGLVNFWVALIVAALSA